MSEIEFKLKFLLNSMTLKVLEITDMTDPKRLLDFNALHCDSKKIQAFCCSINDITYFPMMGVPIDKKEKIHKAIFCEVSIGESLFVSKEYSKSLETPQGFGSFIIEENDTLGFISDQEIPISKFCYAIKDSKRILPLYEVVFEYDQEFEIISRKNDICHRCKKNKSVMFCPSERANFCEDCDSQVHYDDFLKRHRRLYFSDVGQKKFICCAHHLGRVVEYFCQTCMEPICTECKMMGRHATKEFYDHDIVTFLDACHLLKSKILDEQQSVLIVKDSCNKEICNFKEKIGNFKDNIAAVRQKIEQEFKALLFQLDNIENSQRQIINAKYLERLCKSETIKRIEAYSNDLDPADLLTQYKCISDLQSNGVSLVFDKLNINKLDIQGKITLKIPLNTNMRTPVSKEKDRAIKWRIETLHISDKTEF